MCVSSQSESSVCIWSVPQRWPFIAFNTFRIHPIFGLPGNPRGGPAAASIGEGGLGAAHGGERRRGHPAAWGSRSAEGVQQRRGGLRKPHSPFAGILFCRWERWPQQSEGPEKGVNLRKLPNVCNGCQRHRSTTDVPFLLVFRFTFTHMYIQNPFIHLQNAHPCLFFNSFQISNVFVCTLIGFLVMPKIISQGNSSTVAKKARNTDSVTDSGELAFGPETFFILLWSPQDVTSFLLLNGVKSNRSHPIALIQPIISF